MTTSKYLYLSDNFLLEFIYNSDSINTNINGFGKLINQHDNSRVTLFSADSFTPDNANVIDHMYTVVEPTTGKYVYLNQDLVTNYQDYDSLLTNTGSLPVITTGHDYVIQYDTIRIHFRAGYTFDDSEGFYFNAKYLTKGSYDANMASIVYHKYDSYKKQHILPFLISDVSYDSYIDIKIPSLNTLKTEQVNFPTDVHKLWYIISGGAGIDLNSNIQIEFGEILRRYNETTLVSPSLYVDYTFFEFSALQKFAVNAIDQYSSVSVNISEEDPNIGDYFILQPQYSGNNGQTFSDYMSYLNSQINSRWIVIHEISVFEQIGMSSVITANQTMIQDSNYDSPFLFRPVIQNANTAVSYTIQYQIRILNQITQEQIVKIGQFSSVQPNKYGKKLTRINLGVSPTIDKIYNQINQQPLKYNNATRPTTNVFKAEKFIVNFYENEFICVNIGDKNTNIISNSPDNIKLQGESIIKLNDIDTFIKFNVYDNSNGGYKNKNLSSIGDIFLAFIDNNGKENRIVQLFDSSFDIAKGELLFKIPTDRAKEIITYTNTNFYIMVTKENSESVLYSGSWVYSKDTNQKNVVAQNNLKDIRIKELENELLGLNTTITNQATQITSLNSQIKTIQANSHPASSGIQYLINRQELLTGLESKIPEESMVSLKPIISIKNTPIPGTNLGRK